MKGLEKREGLLSLLGALVGKADDEVEVEAEAFVVGRLGGLLGNREAVAPVDSREQRRRAALDSDRELSVGGVSPKETGRLRA